VDNQQVRNFGVFDITIRMAFDRHPDFFNQVG